MATKTVGRYRRAEKIGYGNFGVVYKGVDTQTNRVVAIKTLDLDAVNDEVESVQHEVELLAHLSMAESSNVTKYYGTVLEGSKLWIVMDLCSGGSVRTLLRAGPLEDKFLSVIFRELTVAVVAIHAEGIIHRDIKAANVLITLAGHVKLCDFGVAAHSQLNQTKRHTIVGTPYWMAPEVITEGRSYTNKADIWSMGITFYEIVTGNPPYSEHEAMRALMLITNSRPPRLEGPKYTPSLKDLVALCLDEDPEARPSADALLKHKFIKSYAKTPVTSLRTLVERYVSWKSAHKGHRDSLLMFNPHEDHDDAASIAGDDDNDSVWDFNIEDDTEQSLAQAPEKDFGEPEDMSNAPDSLRELFGVPPKQDDFYIAPEARPMQPIPPVSQGTPQSTMPYNYPYHQQMQKPQLSQQSSQQTVPQQQVPQQQVPQQQVSQHSTSQHSTSHSISQPSPQISMQAPPHPSPLGATQLSSQAATPTAAQIPTAQTPTQMPTQAPAQMSAHSPLQVSAQSQQHTHMQQHGPRTPGSDAPPVLGIPDFGPRLRTHLTSRSQPHIGQETPKADKPPLFRAAASTARQRSTTMGSSSLAPNSTLEPLPPLPAQQSRSLPAIQAQAQAQVQALALAQSHSQTHTPTQAQGQSQIQAQVQAQVQAQIQAQAQAQAQKLHSPTQLQPSPVSSTTGSPSPSPKRPSAHRIEPRDALPRLQLPQRAAAKPLPLASVPAGPVKAAPAAARQPSVSTWASEFPPMPKIDTNVLLDSTPDDLVVDHLLELTVQFKTAVSSLAGHYESERS